MRVGLQLGPVESRGTLPGARPVPAVLMDCQCSGEKQPQNFKQITLNGNKLFFALLANDLDNVLAVCFWRTEEGRKGEEGRDGALYACNVLQQMLWEGYGADSDISKLGEFFNSQPVFLLEDEQASYSQL